MFVVTGLAALAAQAQLPTLILSEALADPSAVADANGEFLELGNPGADTCRLESLTVAVDGQSLFLDPFHLGPGSLFLICRDSLPVSNGGMACGRRWPGLSLANTRGATVSLAWKGGHAEYALPAPRPGISWENTWDGSAGMAAFLPSRGPWLGGDSATPGTRNSRSLRPPARDLGIVAVTWEPAGDGGLLRVRISDRGSLPSAWEWLSLRLDADWDGEAETLLDSVAVPPPASGTVDMEFRAGAGLRGIVRAALGGDDDPGDDIRLLPVEPSRPLTIAEWRPAPRAGEPEWIEIRNRSADSGGLGRRLELSGAACNGMPLGSRAGSLGPGESLILTQSADLFRSRYGAIKARVLQPPGWRALRNTGDTLVLSLAGFTVDSVAYGPISAAAASAPGTPGFSDPAPESAGWTLSGRVAEPDRPMDIEVRVPPGGAFILRAFDLEGDCVRELGAGGSGRHVLAWDGRGEGGRVLAPGPYILALAFSGGTTRKRAVLAGERR